MSENSNGKKAVSIKEAARMLGVGRSTIYNLMNSGRLPFKKLGTRVLILIIDIETFLSALPPGRTT